MNEKIQSIGTQRVNVSKNLFGRNCYQFYYIANGQPFCIFHVENENTVIYNVLTDEDSESYFKQTFEDYCEFIQRFKQ